jgi:hypothetical protein
MILYSVTVTIEQEVEDSWLKWMREKHIKDVMKTGYFINYEIQKLILPETFTDKSTYTINYKLLSLEQYYEYQKKEAPRLQIEHSKKFSGKFTASRTVYQLISG